MPIIVTRSPLRLLVYVMLATPAILLAVDMTVSHRFYPLPDGNDVVTASSVGPSGEVIQQTERVLTSQGAAQARRDLIFGGALLAGGLVAIAWAIRELASPRALLRADTETLSLRLGGLGAPLRSYSWDDIAEVRSGMVDDDGEEVPALSIRFADGVSLPLEPAGVIIEPPWLHVIADDWVPAAHLVAPVLTQVRTRPTANAVDDG